VSAVVDLYDLKLAERRAFVRAFLESMLAAPKELWRPTLVLLDEAHRFCPERGNGEAESTDSVITLLSQGRKRGFCGILATQRLSKLHKDAAAEAVNVLVGRTTLDVDVGRARDLLGFGKQEQGALRKLEPGSWFAFGPAFGTDEVTRFAAAKVTTTHPAAGHRHGLQVPKPSERIRKVLRELESLPQEAEQHASSLEAARKQIAELRDELAKARRIATLSDTDALVRRSVDRAVAELQRSNARLEEQLQENRAAFQAIGSAAARAIARIEGSERVTPPPFRAQLHATTEKQVLSVPTETPRNGELGRGGLRRILTVLVQNADGCDRTQLALLAGFSPKSGTFGSYLGRLRSEGWAEGRGDRLTATDAGRDALGNFKPLPTGRALVDYWLDWCGQGGLRRMLEALVDAGPRGLRRDALAAAAGLQPSSGTFGTYLGKLRTLHLAERGDPIRAARVLLDAG
jgi:uncharacterized protein